MVVKKKVSKEEKALFLGEKDVPEDKIEEEIAKIKEGSDADLTSDIYPDLYESQDPIDKLQKGSDRLKEFIVEYQPGLMIDRIKFKHHLLEILEDWK